MNKETILVSFAESVADQPWLLEALIESIAPHLETSILLVDTHDPHPLLAEKWKGQRIVQYRPNGQRCVDGEVHHEWMTRIEKIANTQDFRELHAFAIRLALLSAFRQGYDVRSFLFLPQESNPSKLEIPEILLAHGNSLPGTTIYYEKGNSSSISSEAPLLVWVDTETSGLYAKQHAVMEIGATLTDATGKHVLDQFDARSDAPDWAQADQEALVINGYYSDSRWLTKTTHEDLIKSFAKWLPKRFRPCGHNVSFDRGFLEASFHHYGLPIPAWTSPPLDTMVMADRMLKRTGKIVNKKLKTVCEYFNLPTQNLHGARVDIDRTIQVYHLMNELLREAV